MSRVIWLSILLHVVTPTSPDEFATQSPLHSFDPRAKIISAIIFAMVVSLMTQIWPLLIALIFSLVFLIVSGLRFKALSRQLKLIAFIILIIALPVYFIQGFNAFIALILRIVTITLVVIVMVLTTASADLANGLRRLGLPKTLVSLLAMTYRYLFLYGDEAARISKAREARGVARGGSLLNRHMLQTISSTAGLILVKAHNKATKVHMAMKARGYTGEVQIGKKMSMTFLDGGLLFAFCVISIVLLMFNWGFLEWTLL